MVGLGRPTTGALGSPGNDATNCDCRALLIASVVHPIYGLDPFWNLTYWLAEPDGQVLLAVTGRSMLHLASGVLGALSALLQVDQEDVDGAASPIHADEL